MRLKIDNVGIAVTDVKRAADWFRNSLGLEVTEEDPSSVLVDLADGQLYVFETDTAKQGPARKSTLEGNEPGLDHISFRVPDVDAVHADLAARGVEFIERPVSKPDWGLRVAAFVDPDRNLYFL